jgi:hypothetical protein
MSLIKYNLKTNSITILLLLFCYPVWSQPDEKVFSKKLCIINIYSDSLKKITNDSIKKSLCAQIETELESVLSHANSFKLNLDTLKHIGKVFSPDNKFRIFTWNVQLNDGKHRFYSLIQLNPEQDSICKLYHLRDSSQNYSGTITNLNFTLNRWYGTLYYEIVSCKIGKKVIYILLGMHFNDLFTNRKIIESMCFDDKGLPVFGVPIFQNKGKVYNRIVFDYSVNAVMNLRYEKHLKMIIFDHLSPPSPMYAGDYKYYGPDFSFDGLKFEKNKWVYYSNVDFRKAKK